MDLVIPSGRAAGMPPPVTNPEADEVRGENWEVGVWVGEEKSAAVRKGPESDTKPFGLRGAVGGNGDRGVDSAETSR